MQTPSTAPVKTGGKTKRAARGRNSSMTHRERFVAALLFQKPDRIPFMPGHGRKSTLAAWHQQGLPPGENDYHRHVCRLLGIDENAGKIAFFAEADFRMMPQFEERVLERKPGTLVVQDWKGNVCEISDEFDVTYLRTAIDFVTRRWIRCPVESRADWTDMARRYNLDTPGRFQASFAQRAAELKERDHPCGIAFSGPFWQLREWLGFEGLCMMFKDEPDFVQEMVDFWEKFVAGMLHRILDRFVPDFILISEDMAYKQKPMIGPDMCRRFLVPCWSRWTQICKSAGVRIIEVDSDGYIGDLIPVWREAGINCNSPLEVAALNDLPGYLRQFGTGMAYRGGVDKRAMAAGGETLRREFERLQPAIRQGGYIPSCDHGIPSDVSWPNFVEYCRLLAEATGWL